MKFLSLLILASVIASCGVQVKKAKHQEGVKLDIPKPNGGMVDTFSLTNEQTIQSYVGNLIFWQDDAKVEQIQAMAEVSQKSRNINSAILDYLVDKEIPQRENITKLEIEKAAKGLEMKTLIREGKGSGFKVILAQKAVTNDFFASRLDALEQEGALNSVQRGYAETWFPRYCEAKLWELATSYQLSENFALRPTPLEMCEYYYADKYFANDELCGRSLDVKTGKNYFKCIWEEGVLKSPLFAEGLADQSCRTDDIAIQDKIKGWYNTGLIQKALTDNAVPRGALSYRELLANAINNSGRLSPFFYLRGGQYPEFKSCPEAFFKETIDRDETGNQWVFAKLSDLRKIVEVAPLTDTPYKLLKTTGDNEVDRTNSENLTQYIRVFAERKLASGAEVPASVGDVFNNMPVNASFKAYEPYQNRVFSDKVFDKLKQIELQFIPAALRERNELTEQQLEESRAELERLLTEDYEELNKEKRDLLSQSINLVRGEVGSNSGVQYLREFEVLIEKSENIAVVELHNPHLDRSIIGCVYLTEAKPCYFLPEKNDQEVTALTYNSATGQLVLEAQIEELELLQFNFENKDLNKPSFNLMPKEMVLGNRIKLEMTGANIGGHLSWVAAQVEILNSIKTIAYGAANMDNFDHVASRLSLNLSKK